MASATRFPLSITPPIVKNREDFRRSLSATSQDSSEVSNSIPSKNNGRTFPSGRKLELRLLQRLDHTLRDSDLLRPGQRVLLAVSGGQDSVCLLHLLKNLSHSWGWGWDLGIVHCDHQWSSTARSQAAHVAQMAQALGLNYYQALTVDPVPGEGPARSWRYGVLQRIAVLHSYDAIVTAHTASDRIETALFNIFRGTGLQGLQSLTWKRPLSPGLSLSRTSAFRLTGEVEAVESPNEAIAVATSNPSDETLAMSRSVDLVRPLLNVTRTELRELREELPLPLWPDPSNGSLDIDRNRIRNELLPYLRKHFNSGVDKSLARWAEILSSEQLYLDGICEEIIDAAVEELRGEGGEVTGRKLDLRVLRALEVAIQRRVLKRFSDGFSGKSLGFEIVEEVRRNCVEGLGGRSGRGWRVSVPGGCYLRIEGDELIVGKSPRRRLQKCEEVGL